MGTITLTHHSELQFRPNRLDRSSNRLLQSGVQRIVICRDKVYEALFSLPGVMETTLLSVKPVKSNP